MLTVYQAAFWFGVFYAAISFLLGHLGPQGADGLDGGALDGDLSAEGPFPDNLEVAHPSPLKPIVIATFLIVFGGTGMLGEIFRLSYFAALGLALALGGAVSAALFRWVVIPLYRLQNTSAATRDQLIGLEALVTTPIYENGFGTISYRYKENTYNAPAKSLTGKYIPQGQRTVIVRLEGKAFIVHVAEEFSNK